MKAFSTGRRNDDEKEDAVMSLSPFHKIEDGQETKEDGDDTTFNAPRSLPYCLKLTGFERTVIRASTSVKGMSYLSSS